MRKKFSFILGILAVFTMVFTSFAEVNYFPQDIKYSQTQFKSDLEVLKELLEKNHANLYENVKKEELDDLFKKSFEDINSNTTINDFHFIVAKIISKVGDGHTRIKNSKYLTMMIDQKKTFLPLKIIKIGDNWYNDALYEYIPVGAQITKINNMDINSVIEKLKYVAASETKDKDGLTNKIIGMSLSKLYPIYVEERTSHDIEFIDPTTNEKQLITINNSDVDINSLSHFAHSNYLKNSFSNTHEPLKATFIPEKNTALLKISTFMPQNSDEFKIYIDKFFEKVKYDGINTIIYDVRGNLGGDPTFINHILSYINTDEFKSSEYLHVKNLSLYRADLLTESNMEEYKALMLDYQQILNDEETKINYEKENNLELTLLEDNSIIRKDIKQKPAENNLFLGQNYVLVDEASFSSGSIFPQRVQKLDNGFVVGTKTSGNFYETTAGHMLFFELPNSKISVKIPLGQLTIEKEIIDGIDRNSGVIADYKIELDYNDYLNSKDTQLNYILNMIK